MGTNFSAQTPQEVLGPLGYPSNPKSFFTWCISSSVVCVVLLSSVQVAVF